MPLRASSSFPPMRSGTRRWRWWLCHLPLLLVQSCGHAESASASPANSSGPAQNACPPGTWFHTADNPKYRLAIDLCGEQVGAHERASKGWAVDSTWIRALDSTRKVRFEPVDAEALKLSFAYYADVWSPDGDYLVLPLGRFDGFVVAPAAQAFDLRAHGKTIKLVASENDNETGLRHEFKAWRGSRSFEFVAGLSELYADFSYDITRERVASRRPRGFVAIISARRRDVLKR